MRIQVIRRDGNLTAIVPRELVDDFQMLVHRGANLWPGAIPQIKEFADLVTNGAVLQDYEREKALTNTATAPQGESYAKDDDKKSASYGNCKNCGRHFNDHEVVAAIPLCPNQGSRYVSEI